MVRQAKKPKYVRLDTTLVVEEQKLHTAFELLDEIRHNMDLLRKTREQVQKKYPHLFENN